MNTKQSFARTIFSSASLPGQGIVAAPTGVLCAAKYGARKTRNCGKPGLYAVCLWQTAYKCPHKKGKQIAVQDDKVMGFDVHIMVVPSGNGTTTVPLPHPFIGKLADKLLKT